MTRHSRQHRSGVTLLEILLAIVILAIGMLGATGFRYYSALRVKHAHATTNALRAGQSLIDSWAAMDGTTGYRPEFHLSPSLTVATSNTGPDSPSGFTELGNYEATVDDVLFYATLSYQDSESGYRTLSVIIGWRDDYSTGTFGADDETVSIATCVMFSE